MEFSPPVGKMPGSGPMPTREPGDEQQAEPPLRHRVEGEGGAGREPVEAPAAAPRADHAEVDPDHRRQDGGETDQRDRRPHPVDDELRDRHVVADGDAQVALRGVLQVREELLRQRLVEPVLLAERVELLLGDHPSPGQAARRVAGQHPEQEEVDDEDEQQAPHRPQHLAEDVAPVAPPTGRGLGGGLGAGRGERRHRVTPGRPPRTAGASRTPRHRPAAAPGPRRRRSARRCCRRRRHPRRDDAPIADSMPSQSPASSAGRSSE